MMFCAATKDHTIEYQDNCYIVPYTDEIEVDKNVWKSVKELIIGDKIVNSDGTYDIIKNIVIDDNRNYILNV